MDRDNQPGRMLFTDFDASEKGRPEPVSLPGEPSLFAALPNIDRLAATLDIDFEDDDEEASPFHQENPDGESAETASGEHPPKTDPPAPLSEDDGGDDVLLLASLDDPAPADAPPPAVPSWSDFASSLKRTSPEAAAALFFEAASALPSETVPDAFAPDHSAGAPQTPPADGEAEDFDADGLDDDFFDETEEDEEMDVLSLLSPDTGEGPESNPEPDADEFDEDRVHQPFEGDWRGHRLGVTPPRARPYGGIKRLDEWYRPPEEDGSAEDGQVERVTDWFEPPENRRRSLAPSRDTTRLVPRPDVSVPTPAGDETETDHLDDLSAAAEPSDDPSTTTTVDIFADMDLEKMWKDKLNQSSATSGRSGDSRYVDLFEDVDLDAAWEEKRNRPDSRRLAERKQRSSTTVTGASTIVMPASALDGQDTMIMSSAELGLPDIPAPAAPERSAAGSSRRSARKKRKKSPPISANITPDSDALGFLDDLDSFLDDGGDGGDAEAAATAKKPRASALPSTIEELEIDDLISVADEKPTDADAAADSPPADGEPAGEAAADAAALEEVAGAAPDVPAEEEDYIPLGNVIGGSEYATTEVVGADAPARDVPTTTDDVIDQVDFGDEPAVDDTVEAPVLDDSVIDTEIGNAGPDADELMAIIASGDAAEAAGNAEGAEEEAPVAVDPMSVFSSFDDMDFSDDDDMLDDEVKAMLAEDAEGDASLAEGGADEKKPAAAGETAVPTTLWGKAKFFARRMIMKVVPGHLLERANTMIAWRDNWWFYCDLLAAVIASASLAVIFSYYFWYRG